MRCLIKTNLGVPYHSECMLLGPGSGWESISLTIIPQLTLLELVHQIRNSLWLVRLALEAVSECRSLLMTGEQLKACKCDAAGL